jgi:ribose 1,5-bisphosphokinase
MREDRSDRLLKAEGSTDDRLGPGRLVLVVGPSGAGKDSILRFAEAQLGRDPGFVFPKRAVTRPPSLDEDNVSLREEDFVTLAETGGFALHWRAHGQGYGLPLSINVAILAGATVVCNVSRTIIETARARYARVAVVEITAAPDILAARLAARGRASDGPLAVRLDRASAFADLRADVTIDNGGRLEDAADQFTAFLTGK